MMAAAASAVATGYIPAYINLYYTDTIGMSIGTIGLIIMITKITDGISDIIMGMIIDRTNTKLGKARPWLLAGAFGLAATMMLLFGCPAKFSMLEKAIFCAAMYFLACPVFGTMVGVASHSVINLISAESDDRAVLGVFKSYGSLIPVLVIGLVVPGLLSSMGENQTTYTIITAIFAAMAIVSGVLAVLLIRENVTERSRGHVQEKQKVGESLRALVKNKYFIYMVLGVIAYNLTAAPVATYYAKYIFGDVGKATLINLPSMLMIFLLPFAIPVVKKWGKRTSIMVGLGASAASHLLILFANDNLGLFMIGKVSERAEKLVRVTQECVELGLAQAKPWNHLGDIADAINTHAKENGYSVVEEIGGHGVGLEFHEEPWVSYVTPKGSEMLLVPGMIFTIEPMINEGSPEFFVDEDNDWTVYTEDDGLSAQVEYMVRITDDGAVVMTK